MQIFAASVSRLYNFKRETDFDRLILICLCGIQIMKNLSRLKRQFIKIIAKQTQSQLYDHK